MEAMKSFTSSSLESFPNAAATLLLLGPEKGNDGGVATGLASRRTWREAAGTVGGGGEGGGGSAADFWECEPSE